MIIGYLDRNRTDISKAIWACNGRENPGTDSVSFGEIA